MSKPDPFLIEPPDGVMYRWVVTHVKGVPTAELGKRFDDLEDALNSGWKEVPVDRYPAALIRGCVLLERPKAEADAGLAAMADHARQDWVEFAAILNAGGTLELPAGFRVISDDDALTDPVFIATAQGWVTMEFYRSQERANGTNPLDGE